MPTRNHPASVAEVDDALGAPGSLNASKKVQAAEELFEIVLDRAAAELAASGRYDRLATAFRQRMAIIAGLARNRPQHEFEEWIDRFLDEHRRCRRAPQKGARP